MNCRKAYIIAWLLLASFATAQTASAAPTITDTLIRAVFVDVQAERLSINGINFGGTEGVATIAGSDGRHRRVTILDWAETTITAELLPTAPGNYMVLVIRAPININNLLPGQFDAMAVTIGEVRVFGGNTAGGTNALVSNGDGDFNTAYGFNALTDNSDGDSNTASGSQALESNDTGSFNTASGARSLRVNTEGIDNTATGYQALQNNNFGGGPGGDFNTATGANALQGNITANRNTATGFGALRFTTSGGDNTASGYEALRNNTTGTDNTAFGIGALNDNTTGSRNIALGGSAGAAITTGSGNIAIGNVGRFDDSNTIRIGGPLHARTFIAGIHGISVGVSGIPAFVDGSGRLGTVVSSRRYKEEIEDMVGLSDKLLNLRPVTFRYKEASEDGDKPIQYGLIAEEVAEVFPDLVVYNEDGEPETVKYHLLATLLLNEFQKLKQLTADHEAQLVSLVAQNRIYESERERLVALEAKVAELTALLAQSVTPVSEAQLASN